MKKWFSFLFLLSSLIIFPNFFGNFLEGADESSSSLSGGACGRHEEPLPLDVDGDLVADQIDNCPTQYNPHQTDLNGNGVGDICEPFELFDGRIQCDLPPCDLNEDCIAQLEESCPVAKRELDFTGQFIVCCDHACVVLSENDLGTAAGSCPAGTCQNSTPHCQSDGDCEGQGLGPCVEGCCSPGPIIPPPICPNKEPQCTPVSPPSPCPPGAPCPVTGIVVPPGCPAGEICDPSGCCVPEGDGGGSCGNGTCEPDLGECGGCPDCTESDCPAPPVPPP